MAGRDAHTRVALVSSPLMLIPDVDESPEGLSITVRHSKTDQAGEGAVVAILPGSFADTCPVRAVAAWRAAGIVDGGLFRRVDRHGRLLGPISGQAVAMVIARAAERAGLAGRYRGPLAAPWRGDGR